MPAQSPNEVHVPLIDVQVVAEILTALAAASGALQAAEEAAAAYSGRRRTAWEHLRGQ
jgi:hypothetical protein